MSCLEEYIEKLSTVPNDVNRDLRLIRNLDKRVEAIQNNLQVQQKKFDAKMKELKQKKITEVPPQLKAEYQSIVEKQKEMFGYAKQKQDIASQLLETVTEHYEAIKNDLKKKIKERPPQEQNLNISKKKKKPLEPNKVPTKEEQFLYQKDLKYCYCNGGSFGEMVGCQNIYCEKEWFHISCIPEKNRPGDGEWYCNDCLKLRDKYKKSTIKDFL